MKKYVRILQILAVCIVLVAGVWLGIKLQNKQTEKYEESLQGLNTTVAVVNQDLGIKNDNTSVNYANTIIETLGSEYIVVSDSVAQNGLENGTYGAIITFPSDFSTNIASINDVAPSQASLGLAINPNLPENLYIPLYNQLLTVQQQINNNIAYAYVETIFEQFHAAQDEIDVLLENDETDMEAVKKVELTDYTELLDLGDMPQITFEPGSPDFEAFHNAVQPVADNMNSVYINSYKSAQEDYDKDQTNITQNKEDIVNFSAQWINDMNTWAKNQISVISTSQNDLKTWRSDALTALGNYDTNIDTAVADAASISNNVSTVENNISTYNTELEKLNIWIAYLQEYQNHLNAPDIYPAPVMPTAAFPQQITPDPLTVNIATVSEDMNTQLTPVKDAISGKVSAIPTVPEITELNLSAPELPTELTNAFASIDTTYATYNPKNYLNKDTEAAAGNILDQFKIQVSGMESDLTSKNAENISKLTSIYTDYNTYVGQLRTNVYNVHNTEQTTLDNSIGSLVTTLNNTSVANHEIMDSFVARMPNSRINSTVNQQVVETTVKPVTYTYDYVRNEGGNQTNYDLYLLIIILALVFIALIVTILLIVKSRANKNKE